MISKKRELCFTSITFLNLPRDKGDTYIVDMYLHTIQLMFWYMRMHRVSKHPQLRTNMCQAAAETVESAISFVWRPPSGVHLICNYYFPGNQGPRPLFYEVLKLITHDKSSLCLVCHSDFKGYISLSFDGSLLAMAWQGFDHGVWQEGWWGVMLSVLEPIQTTRRLQTAVPVPMGSLSPVLQSPQQSLGCAVGNKEQLCLQDSGYQPQQGELKNSMLCWYPVRTWLPCNRRMSFDESCLWFLMRALIKPLTPQK